ncbi:MAG: Transcriptional regulatory protein zraR [Candidatus Angelobacter sp.]|nr:Transcriptional regulatory protein zraR [Candidatus Angelobacter sp.]
MPKNSGSAAYKRCQVIVRNVSGQSRGAETSVAQGAVVLIVDDDEMVRRCLVRLIRAKGYMAQAYSSAEEFLFAKPIDDSVCLLLDATLPGMSGLELQRRLANGSRRLPIIFMSAHDEPCVCEQALRDGAIAFLFKPFNDDALWRAMESVAQAPGERMRPDHEELSVAEHVEINIQGGHHARKVERS